MIGVAKAFPSLSSVIVPSQTPNVIKEHLNRLTHRRNAIVHEGDLARLMRPQTIKRGGMIATDVRIELDWIRTFVVAVDLIT